MRPEAEWLPTARLLPAWLLRWAVAVIEGAVEAWADEDGCPDRPHHGVDCPGDACRFARDEAA